MRKSEPKVPEIVTRCAHWGVEEHRYQGHAVFAELLGAESVGGLTALSVLGRRANEELLHVLDDIGVALSLADPRIWPLKLTQLIASYGATMLPAALGWLTLEDARIGPWACQRTADLLVDFSKRLGDDLHDPERVAAVVQDYLRQHQFVWGFGTPYRQRDERLVAFTRAIEQRGRHRLRFWGCVCAVAPVVEAQRKTAPNVSLGVSAALLDAGVAPTKIGPLVASLMHHMFVANALDSAARVENPMRVLQSEHVVFKGRSPRLSPRRSAAAGSGMVANVSGEANPERV